MKKHKVRSFGLHGGKKEEDLFIDRKELYFTNKNEKHSYFSIDSSTNKKSFVLRTTVPNKKFKAYNIISILGVIWVFVTDGNNTSAYGRGKKHIFEIEFNESDIIFLDNFRLDNSEIEIVIFNSDRVSSKWNKSEKIGITSSDDEQPNDKGGGVIIKNP
jgi:hypothetical protein